MLGSSKVDKRIKEKIVEFIVQRFVNDADYGEEEPHPQKAPPGPVHRESAKPAKKLSAASRTPVTSCTYTLTSGKRKCKQCKPKVSDKTGKFCNCHKRQT